METLVATVLLVVVFMMASLILNNLFSNTIKGNTNAIVNYLNELEYQYKSGTLETPFYDAYKTWDISAQSSKQGNQKIILLEAINTDTKQTVIKTLYENQ